ncbi:4'-phosphopantetheinyl transferase family protein [Microbulbifer elongatus]|uniref:4'-phosphopantetheinyl transferase family protein n=1 Tax=Microbulbifer elongatus TaxID=86173 RepID=UPI001E3D2D7A|nr:4'-phosphopantetheinyl transferase superfamily protein [Microbulbifer elongatus]
MRQATGKNLPRDDRGFIGQVESQVDPRTGVRMVSCTFEVDRYHPCCYDVLGIAMPPSIRRSVPKRQAEFLAGRYAGALALQYLPSVHNQCVQIGIGAQRNPLWPSGVVGSISHVAGMAVCAVAPSAEMDFLGIDVELWMSAKTCREVASTISTGRERDLFQAEGMSEHVALTLIFSAKESLFKALYPAVQDFFGFEVAEASELCLESKILTLRLSECFAQTHSLQREYVCHFTLAEQCVQSVVCGGVPGRASTRFIK